MKNHKKIFQRRLREARKIREWSQAQLADKIGVSMDTIGNIERGDTCPQFSLLISIAKAFGCSLDYLCGLR